MTHIRTYEHKVTGGQETALAGSRVDQRFASNEQWRLVADSEQGDSADLANIELDAATAPQQPGEPGTFDGTPNPAADGDSRKRK